MGRIYRPRFDLILPGETAVEPDLMYISIGRLGIITQRAVKGRPTWWWKSCRHPIRGTTWKPNGNCTRGHVIPEYWILEPYRETVASAYRTVIRNGAGEYTVAAIYHPGDTLVTDRIPGLAIAVADIFAGL